MLSLLRSDTYIPPVAAREHKVLFPIVSVRRSVIRNSFRFRASMPDREATGGYMLLLPFATSWNGTGKVFPPAFACREIPIQKSTCFSFRTHLLPLILRRLTPHAGR